MAKQPRITVLQLDPGVPLGRFEGWLGEGGVRHSIVTLWDKDVPQLASSGDGLLVLGGRMSAHDHKLHPWLNPLADLLADAQSIDLPILGICLGHQVLAEALGGRVEVNHPAGLEEGANEIEWLPAALDDALVGELAAQGPAVFASSHRDAVVELPPDATELARSALQPNQGFRLGSAWGVQFHPEASPEAAAAWQPDPAARAKLAAELNTAEEAISAASRKLAIGFAQIVRGG